MRETFNPFNKGFEKVTSTDLEILKSVAEGWYVEYKRQKPNGKSIAKSISSFANSHGGIYFIGIEADPETNCALNILGVDNPPDVIRDSVRGHLQPFPFFVTYAINLPNGKKVLMVVVPEGKDPPYIHSDGKIYRRQESASDPIPETNRHTIDELYKKAEGYEKELENFRTFDLSFCRGEEEISFLEIFANISPFKHILIDGFFTVENLKKVFERFNSSYNAEEMVSDNKVSFSGSMKFDSLNTYHDSVSLRLLENQNLAYNGTTLILDIFGNVKLLMPINEKHPSSKGLGEAYINVLNRSQKDSISSVRFLDAGQIIGAVFGLIINYVKYLDEMKYRGAHSGTIEIKIRLVNCYRTTLYIESKKFIEYVEEFGVPICMKSTQYFPFFPFTLKINKIKLNPITNCLAIFSHIASALGVPYHIAMISVIEEIQNNNPLALKKSV